MSHHTACRSDSALRELFQNRGVRYINDLIKDLASFSRYRNLRLTMPHLKHKTSMCLRVDWMMIDTGCVFCVSLALLFFARLPRMCSFSSRGWDALFVPHHAGEWLSSCRSLWSSVSVTGGRTFLTCSGANRCPILFSFFVIHGVALALL